MFRLKYYIYGCERYHGDDNLNQLVEIASNMMEDNMGFPEYIMDDEGNTVMDHDELISRCDALNDDDEEDEIIPEDLFTVAPVKKGK